MAKLTNWNPEDPKAWEAGRVEDGLAEPGHQRAQPALRLRRVDVLERADGADERGRLSRSLPPSYSH